MEREQNKRMPEIQTCEILKTHIAVTNMQEAVAFIDRKIQHGSGGYICVSNVHTTVMAYDDESYRVIQNSALLALPDGKPLSVVSRKRGYPQAERVAGPDLMAEIFKASVQKGYCHYFYGSTQETLTALSNQLQEKYPGIRIEGMEAPPFRELTREEDAACIARINQAEADIVWVGLGAPKQEIWMYAHKDSIKGLMIGVGAGFDFHAATVKRAPKWMQNIGMEWFYRLCQNPKRLWKRYVSTNWRFIRLLQKRS